MSEIDLVEVGESVLAIVGAASALAAVLKPAVVKLRALALRTSFKADDAAVEALAVGLEYLSVGLLWAYRVLAWIGLTPKTRDPLKETP